MLGLLQRRRSPSGFSPSSTAEEVTTRICGSGLVAIVTDASSGIGAETCQVLVVRGVHVIMGVRNPSAAERVREDILRQVPTAKIEILEVDLSSMSSVRRFVNEFNVLDLPLNILINNAGIAFVPFKLSEDGIELHFATNHLVNLTCYVGHFLLTLLLLKKIKVMAKESSIEGRVVIVASDSYKHPYREGFCFDKINGESGYNSILAYGQSKLANILHSSELSSRLKEQDAKVLVNSLHPGGVVTNIARYWGFLNGLLCTLGKFILKDVEQGAVTVCYLALHPQVAGVTDKYFVDCNAVELKSHATDKDLGKRLWDFSVSLVR
ncbi:short-chain dehydrogenase TIC 32, chloroplastic-like [Miscanthus floridulus]|uniref:short-chain dehydrogenase TIC 32, chloroplastic-like n=1 Tax=Miscanthus floridulus TaxID=154761 RepID=UPI003459C6D0